MRLTRSLSLLLLLIYSATGILVAQERWRTYLSYGATVEVAETASHLFALSEEGTLLSIQKNTPTNQRIYGREDGLSEAQPAHIAYAPSVQTLLLYYPSGMIDLMRETGIYPVADLKHSSRIRDYRLKAIRIEGERAWLAGAFGLVELDLRRGVILRSAFVGEAIDAIALSSPESLVILRAGKLYTIKTSSPSLVSSAWTPLPLPSSFPISGWKALADDGQSLWLLSSEGGLYHLSKTGEGSRLTLDERESGWEQLTKTQAGVIVTRGDRSLLCSPDGTGQALPGLFARHFSSLHSQSIWGAAQSEGITHYTRTPSGSWKSQSIRPEVDAPSSNVHFTLRAEGGYLYSVNGGRNFDRYYTPGVVQCFDGKRWQAWTARSLQQSGIPSLYDPIDILPVGTSDPTHLYVASWGEGLFELQGGKILRHYGLDNSPLHSISPSGSREVRVGSLARDTQGTLFLAQGMSGSTTGAPVRSLSRDRQWRAYDYPEEREVNAFHTLVILPRGTKWLAEHALLSGAPGVLVFQDKGTASPDDDTHARYTSFVEPSGKVISFSRITSLLVDRASRLWVGMDIGYGRVLRPEDPPLAGKRPIVERPVGGQEPPYHYLLSGLTITAMAADALDRKWMGTGSDGLYLLSAEGNEVLAHYTQENSPLISDAITSLAFEERSGTLYIGTSIGLSALSTQAGEEQIASTPTAYAYPNPLRPEDPEGITFRDLPAGARLRITDPTGGLCALLESPTTELFWNTRDGSGTPLASGIYLVTIYPPASGAPQLLKLAILRP